MKSYCNSSFQISTHSHNGNPDQELHVDFVLTFHLIPQLFESAKKKHNRNVNILMTMLLTPFLKIFPSFKSHIWLNFNCFDIKKEVYWCWIWFSLLDSIKVSAQNDKNQWIDLRQFSSSHGKFWMQSKKDKIFIEKKIEGLLIRFTIVRECLHLFLHFDSKQQKGIWLNVDFYHKGQPEMIIIDNKYMFLAWIIHWASWTCKKTTRISLTLLKASEDKRHKDTKLHT